MSDTKQVSKAELAAEVVALRQRVKQLEEEVASLAAEAEGARDALVTQEFSVRQGYVCTIYESEPGRFIASCPTLHASTEADSRAAASAELDDAIEAMLDVLHRYKSVPPRDVERDAETDTDQPAQAREGAASERAG